MPVYLYENPETKEVVEVLQKVSDKHEYIDEKGISYTRVWTPPQVTASLGIDAFSSKAFVEKTRGKNLSVGDLWDMSAEMGDRRENKDGVDFIRKNHDDKQIKKRKGKKLPTSDVRTSNKSRL